MIIVTESNYASFKATFVALGGGAHDVVTAADTTASGGNFTIMVPVVGGLYCLMAVLPIKPPTFPADFPQAILVGGLGL